VYSKSTSIYKYNQVLVHFRHMREQERKFIGWKKQPTKRIEREEKRKMNKIYIDGFYRWQWCASDVGN